MGLVSRAVIGAAHGLVLARQETPRFGAPWGAAMPLLLGAGWAATTVIGISVEDRFTVFGASDAQRPTTRPLHPF
jgi:hypothetical protein